MLVGRAQTCSWPPLTSVLNRYDFKAWPDDPRWVLHAFSSIPLVGYDIPEADLTIDFLFAYLTLHHIYIYIYTWKKHTCIYIYISIYIYANPFGSGSCAYWEWVFENQLSKGHLIMLSCSPGGAVAAPTYGSVFHFRSHLESLNLGGRLCLCNTAGQVKPQINWELIECKFKFPSPFRS